MNFRGIFGVAIWCGILVLAGCESNPDKQAGVELPIFGAPVDTSGGRAADAFAVAPDTWVPGSLGAAPSGIQTVTNGRADRFQAEIPTPAKLTIQPDTTQPAGQISRVIIYSGLVQLVVPDIASSIESIRQMAIGMGGYLQEMDGKSITVRVPAAKFDLAMAEVARRGEVANKQIKAADVTEELRDLDIRLANAEETRKQLLSLLEKSAKMEDTVKIEAELERVTEQVELYKGKIRYMQLDVAYSVLKVQLNSRVPQADVVAAIPFPWVRELGQGVSNGGSPSRAEQGGWFSGGIGFDLPVGYIRYYQEDDRTEAMSAEGVLIKVQRHDNYKGGDITFWSTLAKRSLLKNGAVAVTSDVEAKADGQPGRLFEGSKDITGSPQKYLLLVAASGDRVYTFEAWGPKEAMEKDMAGLEKAAKSTEAK